MGVSTFRVGAHDYEARALSTFDQWELARLLRDVLSGLALLKKAAPKGVTPDMYVRAMAGLSGNLTREESLAITRIALSCVMRKDGNGWQVIQPSGGDLQYADITMPQQVEIIWHVLERHDLVDFFSVSPSDSGTPAGDQASGRGSRTEKTS
jgi:tail assembly chaperone